MTSQPATSSQEEHTTSRIESHPLFDALPKEGFFESAKPYFRQITQQITAATINVGEDDHKTDCIVVYQAYNSTIANHAVKNQTFEHCSLFDMHRMTWIKPNYCWMMYRSEFATAHNQTNILALYIDRDYFETVILKNAICTMYYPELASYYGNEENWKKQAMKKKMKAHTQINKKKKKQQQELDDGTIISQESTEEIPSEEDSSSSDYFIRCQWDPYHTPAFGNLNGGLTRAIQLGLKGQIVEDMLRKGMVKRFEDITDYAQEQYAKWKECGEMIIPVERLFDISCEETKKRLGIVATISQDD